ncbi:MAG: NAD(+)/NADH kinase [Nanoarchaeota archaeon]|nr:NAD(+)/NADH kinase [Nanoarchaeota archaeon]
MAIKNILCVLKTTGFEHYQNRKDVFNRFEESRKKIIEESHHQQKELEKTFRELCELHSFSLTTVSDRKMHEHSGDSFDLIITLGGDGTFLNAAQQFKNSLLMGINSDENLDPSKGSMGALTSATAQTIEQAFARLEKGDYTIEHWKRLYGKINGKRLPDLATNDIFFGAQEAYKTSSFEIYWDKKIEAFRGCSGIVFTTGMGSTSWYKNLGGTSFANDLPIYGFVIRDPQLARQPHFVRGIVDGEEEMIIKPLRTGYILSFDSKDNPYVLKETDELRIGLSKKEAVRVIRFE